MPVLIQVVSRPSVLKLGAAVLPLFAIRPPDHNGGFGRIPVCLSLVRIPTGGGAVGNGSMGRQCMGKILRSGAACFEGSLSLDRFRGDARHRLG